MSVKALRILIFILLLGGIIFFITLKMKPLLSFRIAIKKALKLYPRAIVENCERLFRKETANFTSGQFIKTFSPGMEKFSSNYPYGWQSLDKGFWSKNPAYKPTGFKSFIENNTGKTKYFIIFPSVEASVMTLCYFLSIHNNNGGRWYALDATLQAKYAKELATITPKIANEYV